ncbi:unnamed protein product [Urochloa humidicola]
MRKDAAAGGGSGIAPVSAPALLCFDIKPFLAALTALTLLAAAWQLRPYHSLSLLSSPFPAAAAAACAQPAFTSLPRALAVHSKNAQPSQSAPNSTASLSSTPPPPAALPGPERREFRAVGSAAALFVQMGAYRGGPYTFAVIGLASKPTHVYGKPWFRCEWEPTTNSSSSSPPLRAAKTYHMLPDWGYGRVYTVVVVNCTFSQPPNADNAGGRLILYAYHGPSRSPSSPHERILALEESPGSSAAAAISSPAAPPRYDYLYCGSSLYGDLSGARVREWIAYHAHLFGERSHFVFHDAGGVGPAVRAALEPWVRAGRATVEDVRAQAEYDGWYHNQFLVVNDCLHRYRHAARWTFFFDVDEYIFVPDGRKLEDVLRELEPYTQFTIEQNPMSSRLCVDSPEADYSNQWGFEKLVFRNSITGVRRDRKYAIQAKNAYATGVHMSENIIGNTTHKTEHLIRYYHYHNTINVLDEVCREFVPIPPKGGLTWSEKTPWYYDDSMKRVADAVREFERKTIGDVRL